MNDGNARQQIVEKIKNSSNILVTVSNDPSVDELSAALGLTLLLNNMKKHATAVFSGAIPPAITFLDPQKTFENTVNSLRDFIIALDKEKADHLRYKVEGDVVKIFITPYRTTITDQDLDFSQGDYNVELVLALGVKKRDNLDAALTAHGRILHDATVATISIGDTKSELGSLDWREENASSLSEVLVSLTESLKGDKSLLDEQIATAFLTGIVAATDRFSNNRTSSKVMTMAAQLMAAGANQQLIASKLEEANEIGQQQKAASHTSVSSDGGHNSDGTTDLSEGESTKLDKQPPQLPPQPEATKNDGSLNISHELEGTLDEVAASTAARQQAEAAQAAEAQLQTQQSIAADSQSSGDAEQAISDQLSSVLPPVAPADTVSVADLQQDLAEASAEMNQAADQSPVNDSAALPALSGAVGPDSWQKNETPSMGGTLNATTEQAAFEQRKIDEDSRNHTILSHTSSEYLSDPIPSYQSAVNSAGAPNNEPPLADMFASAPTSSYDDTSVTARAHTIEPPAPEQHTQTLSDLDSQHRQPHEEARAAIDAAFGEMPPPPQQADMSQSLPDFQPESNLPPLPDFSTLPPLPPMADVQQTSGALPPEKLEDMFAPAAPAPEPKNQSNDPGQFKIPGQL